MERQTTPARENNFDAIRLVLASAVFFVHAYDLSRNEALRPLLAIFNSEIAVDAFFVVSGYLIFMSCEKASSLLDYASKRIRRIAPAYITVVMVCAISGAAFTSLPITQYFSAELLRYLIANLTFLNFLQPSLPGVFNSAPHTNAVNGALWTIKVEVAFYCVVPIFVWLFRKTNPLLIITLTYGLSVTYFMGLQQLAVDLQKPFLSTLAMQLPGQLSFFMCGAFFYYYFHIFSRYAHQFAALGVVLFCIARYGGIFPLLPAAVAILVIYAAYGIKHIGNVGKFGDFSYGVYIWHFPILQALIALGYFRDNPYSSLALAFSLLITAALISWHIVERPFLKKSSHYRRMEETELQQNIPVTTRAS